MKGDKGRFSHLEFEDEQKKVSQAKCSEEEISREKLIAENAAATKKEAQECFYYGKFDRALVLWGKLLDYENILLSWERQCEAMFFLQCPDEALSCANMGLKHFPNAAPLLALKGLSYAYLGDRQRGAEYCDAAIQQDGKNAQAFFCRGAMLLNKKTKPTARGSMYCFQQALDLADDKSFYTLKVALCLKTASDFSSSLFYFQNIIREKKPTAFTLSQIARCQKELGFHKEAKMALEEAIHLDPLYQEACDMLTQMKEEDSSFTRKLFSRLKK